MYFTDAPRVGGAERYLADVVRGMIIAGHDVTVAAPQHDVLEFVARAAPAARTELALSDAYAGAASPARRAHALARQWRQFRRLLGQVTPDVLHINNGGYPGSDLCRMAAIAARGTRTVMSVHSSPWPRETSSLARTQGVIDRLVWGSLNAVHASSRFVGTNLTELRGTPERLVRAIPYGVDDALLPDTEFVALRRRLVPSGRGLVVGMISGTADAGKGHDVFIEALASSQPSIVGVIVGPMPERGNDRFSSGHPVWDRIRVEGSVPHEAIGAYLGAIDVLVVPSIMYESLPLVVLEAMSARKPVIASRLSGIPEAIVDGVTGHLFTPGDAGALTRILDDAATAPLRLTEMGVIGRSRWADGFSIEAQTRATLAMYDEVIRPDRSQ